MFDVYVVGSNEPGHEGLDKLAELMSARYGLPLDDLRGRLARGRFRVKANVDRATGEQYVKDLALIGGRCSLEPASSAAGQSIPPPIAVPTGRSSATSTPPAGVYQSGLSAAFSAPDMPAADIGALGRADSFALASLDGHDGQAGAQMPPPTSFAPPPAVEEPKAAVKFSPAPAPAKPPRPKDVPVELDPFRPPDAADDDRPVEIAADELEHRARRRMSTPPANEVVVAPPLSRRSTPSISPVQQAPVPKGPPAAVAIVRPRGRLGYLGDERVRFAVGVLLAIVLGFVPAHVVASIRERAAYHSIDSIVEQKQIDATAQEDYDALDAFRARQLDDKRAARRSIALMALAIWGLAGGAVAYGWFRRVPWDRLDAPKPT